MNNTRRGASPFPHSNERQSLSESGLEITPAKNGY